MTGSLATCQEMISSGHTLTNQLQDKMKQVQSKWDLLKEEVTSFVLILTIISFESNHQVVKKNQTLDAATEAFQFFSDCNETESVIKEFITLAQSKVNNLQSQLLQI